MQPEQYSQLQLQLQTHFQILVQVYALCLADTKNSETEQNVLKLILDLDEFRKNSIYWKNILAISVPQPKENRRITRSQTKSPLKREEITSIFHGVHGFDVLPSWLKQVKQTPPEHYQDDTLLRKIFSPFGDTFENSILPKVEKVKGGRLNFTEAEDRLLALGLQKYGTQDWKSIVQFYLPTKTEKQLTNRYKNMSSTRGADNNPIKIYNHTKKQPISDEEKQLIQDGVKKYGNNWELIHLNLLPHRKPNSIKKYWQENPGKTVNGIPIVNIGDSQAQNTTFKVPKESKKRKSNEISKIPSIPLNPIPIIPNTSQSTMNPQLINPQLMNPQLMNPHLINPQLIPQQSINQQTVNHQSIQPQFTQRIDTQRTDSNSQFSLRGDQLLFLDSNSRSSLFSNFELPLSKSEISFGTQVSLLSTGEKTIEWEFENIDSDDDDTDIFEFENIDSDNEIEVVPWSKDEDRLILKAYIESGYKNIPSTFKSLRDSNQVVKSTVDIQTRISELMKEWKHIVPKK